MHLTFGGGCETGRADPTLGLVQASTARDPREALVAQAAPLRAYLGAHLSDPQLVEEVAQESLTRALARLDTLREPAHVRAWLYGIARNVAGELLRARRRYRPLDADAPATLEAVDPPRVDERGVDTRRALARLPRAIDRLSGDRRRALLLRVDDELGYDEIASRLGWSLAKVKNEIHRARLDLRAAVAAAVVAFAVLGVSRLGPRVDGAAAPAVVAFDARCIDDSAEILRLERASGACLSACPVFEPDEAYSTPDVGESDNLTACGVSAMSSLL
jgi:RNA polymerase sigma-70 factor (ECF subfamily)